MKRCFLFLSKNTKRNKLKTLAKLKIKGSDCISKCLNINRTVLKYFNTVYEILHLYCGYDGTLNMNIFKEGIVRANQIIDWCEHTLKNEN